MRTLQLVDASGRSDARRWQRLDSHAQAEFAAPARGLAYLVHAMDETEIGLDAATAASTLDATPQALRTDNRGQARLRLRSAGQHLIATTVLRPPARAGEAWTSRFATLGFAVAAR